MITRDQLLDAATYLRHEREKSTGPRVIYMCWALFKAGVAVPEANDLFRSHGVTLVGCLNYFDAEKRLVRSPTEFVTRQNHRFDFLNLLAESLKP